MLAHGHQGLLGKGMSLLWIIWLLAGPSYNTMEHFCGTIQSFISDCGVESGICDLPNLLPVFWAWSAGTPPPDIDYQSYLFPNAVYHSGWHHLWDNITMFACYSLVWFPEFLEQLNSLSEQQSRYPDISFGRTYVNLTIAPETGEEITEADHQLGAQIDSLLPAS